MDRFFGNFRAIKQSSSQKTKIFFLVRSTKTWKSNSSWEGLFCARFFFFFFLNLLQPSSTKFGGWQNSILILANNTPPYSETLWSTQQVYWLCCADTNSTSAMMGCACADWISIVSAGPPIPCGQFTRFTEASLPELPAAKGLAS